MEESGKLQAEKVAPVAEDNHEGQEQNKMERFMKAIGREDLIEVLTPHKPWAYWTMEIYRNDIKGGGGLGMLASDTLEVAKSLGIPAVFITPFYRSEREQEVESFEQQMKSVAVTPEERGFHEVGDVSIDTRVDDEIVPTKLSVYAKQDGSVTLLTVTEPNFGELYQGANNSDHRLYQEVALGVGGYKAVKGFNLEPSENQQLNEAPTVFSALARLDARMDSGVAFAQAFEETKEKTIYTNHTLVQAVEAEFTLSQFEKFVIPNIRHAEIVEWLTKKIEGKGGKIKLSTLAIELAGKMNGVSLIHAREASKVYKDYDGNPVTFEGITNGISMTRWADPELLLYYHEIGVIDEFDLPTADFKEKLAHADPERIKEIKSEGRRRLRETLAGRKNQYNEEVQIPDDAKIFNWKKRIAEYKRPGMMFENPAKLLEILEETNGYIVMAGKAHASDKPMQEEITRILKLVDQNPGLKKRVHFIQNYDEVLARACAQGADVSINNPRVRDEQGVRMSTEACGTSWEKDVIGNAILISTSDGGAADTEVVARARGDEHHIQPFLEIKGDTFTEEVESLYESMREAGNMLATDGGIAQWKKQMQGFLPVISGARMEKDYLNFAFPQKK